MRLLARNGRRNHDEIRFWKDYINGESYIYDGVIMPLLHQMSPERAHRFAIAAASWGIVPKDRSGDLGRFEDVCPCPSAACYPCPQRLCLRRG